MGAKIMITKRMGALGKLSDFGQTKIIPLPEPSLSPPAEISPAIDLPVSSPSLQSDRDTVKLVTLNIKIDRIQQEWSVEIAKQVRGNNSIAVPPADRVYPQHLIGVAIDLLHSTDVDWSQVKNINDLKKLLTI